LTRERATLECEQAQPAQRVYCDSTPGNYLIDCGLQG
jgi:hypothetical protein